MTATPHEPQLVVVDSKKLGDQWRAMLTAFVLTFILAMAAVSGLLYAYVLANRTIDKLAQDSLCRSEAAVDEQSALNNLVIAFATQPNNRTLISDAVRTLQVAHDRQADAVAIGCSG